MPLALRPSFDFGDRPGLDTAGHIAAVRGTKFASVFARPLVRENEPTRRTLQQVIDGAKRTIEFIPAAGGSSSSDGVTIPDALGREVKLAFVREKL